MTTPGTLYLVPAPLDFGCDTQVALDRVLPAATLEIASTLQHWICENAKSTRAYLKRFGASIGEGSVKAVRVLPALR